ncbi:hypothetical protein NBRC10512_000390 [Rhodotorula toruloides]|uniref:Arrestin-like, C-terminal domain protein n=1 Tax=Rhodotorula toruloides (strain NP11) TaxID=1130832 RepID=M7WLG8_RHOT1|nr:Arrestin-like, C-terminal domain protein [Rhodotorula toruloides NP11]EMS21342.1 Arrestin-like, C-terminal domain protein [Rhodotorula toruloides NP11]
MSKDQPRITLRPPPHRDYLQGYPGIPASSPSDPAPPLDPLLPLSLIHRPQAHLTGTVEIRSPSKGGPIRAKWLSVELEKIETVPPPPNSGSSGKGAASDAKFVELIGIGPSHTWTAGQGGDGAELTTTISRHEVLSTPRKKGLKGLLGRNKDKDSYPIADEDSEDDGYDVIPDGNYPFKIAVPEGLPPSVEVDSKYRGIAYQLVASLAIKPKKGLLKTASKPTVLTTSASILLHKGDILPSWPIYEPLLPLPLPAGLPWADEHTIGETREGRLAIRVGEASGGEVWIKATREKAAYGPGDLVQVFVQVGWGGVNSIRASRCLTRLDFVLRETLTYRYPSPANPSYIVRAPPKVTSIVTANASVSPDPNNDPTAFAVLYQNEPVSFAMSGIVPTSHSRVTVRTAKHLDVAYHLKIRAMIEGGDEVSIDNWPIVLGNVPSRQAKGVINDIGWVEGLCDRPGLRDVPAPVSMEPSAAVSMARPTLVSLNSSDRQTVQPTPAFATPQNTPPPPPPVEDKSRLPPPVPSTASYGDEKTRLLANSPYGGSSSGGGSTAPLHVTNPTPISPRTYGSATPPPPLPSTAAARASFVPSPTAEEEKRRYYEQATRSRDLLQSSLRASQDSHQRPSSIATNGTRDRSLGFSPVSLEDPGPVLLQKAMLVRRDEASSPPQTSPYGGVESGSYSTDAPLSTGQLAPPTRSNTIMALSGSEVSSIPPSVPPPAPVAPSDSLQVPASSSSTSFLGRSLTSAESEKRRLFLEAKEIARRRQEEARLELERQNRALAELEFEEAQNAFEEKLIVEAELERQEEERRKKEEYAAQQRERIRQDEERWRIEEEERRAKALAELEDKRRRAEQALQEELRRFEEQQRAEERARAEEIEQQLDDRKREDEMKRQRAEEMRRLDEEREREEEERRMAAQRKAAFERERAEQERRRREAEAERAAQEEAARQRRLAEEQERAAQEEAAHHRRIADEQEFARRRMEEERLVAEAERQRLLLAEEQARRAQAAEDTRRADLARIQAAQQPAYPPANGPQPQHYGAGLTRTPSVASFAPSLSAAQATADVYAQAIAQQATLQEEKAAYLRQLRMREEERRAHLASPDIGGRSASLQMPSLPHSQAPVPATTVAQGYPSGRVLPSRHPQAVSHDGYAYSTPTRQNSYSASVVSTVAPTTVISSAPPPMPPLPQREAAEAVPPAQPVRDEATPPTSTYKTAAEEKEELAARRRAEETRAQQAASAPPPQPEDDDMPPSYPAGATGQQGSTRTAAQEKAELDRYYQAKAAVQQAQTAPPPPEPRPAPNGFDRSPLATPVPLYQPAPGLQPAYPSNLLGSAPPSEPSHQQQGSTPSESSHEVHRDPSIAAGKRVQRSTSSSYGESTPGMTAFSPSAPSAPQPAAHGYDIPPHPPQHAPYDHAGDSRQDALGGVEFGSFGVDSFPEFADLSSQLAAINAARQ